MDRLMNGPNSHIHMLFDFQPHFLPISRIGGSLASLQILFLIVVAAEVQLCSVPSALWACREHDLAPSPDKQQQRKHTDLL